MLTRYLRLPNVLFKRNLSISSYPSQALAQAIAPAHHTTSPALNPLMNRYTSFAPPTMETDILPVDPTKLGTLVVAEQSEDQLVSEWSIDFAAGEDLDRLRRAAQELRDTETPVAFPTETVYGLAGDATRGSATRAIFAAKGRPADNPLIVHVWSIAQLRELLRGKKGQDNGHDPIPEIYKPLIRKFWPGPLTMIMPNPEDSVLAPEVTAGLNTFGARMPRSILALALIKLAGVPLAGPSANASTRPSPTAAEHVKDDLEGRIHTIIDGGPCEVGVESTVVDGLSSPPTILRPGGITVEQLRQCEGWENVVVGYKDKSEEKGSKPRAPGMRYRHYSPKASVVLYEAGAEPPKVEALLLSNSGKTSIGIVRTKTWPLALGLTGRVEGKRPSMQEHSTLPSSNGETATAPSSQILNLLKSFEQHQIPHAEHVPAEGGLDCWDIDLGADSEGVARGLFSALRELDKKDVDVIYVEGIDDTVGDDIAAAVMNRLRKAAEVRV